MSYVKLFNSILDSTIWQQPAPTKLVWITMLAMSDKNGEVQASIPGLAVRAGVGIEDCKAALECLSSPDEYSRSQDDGGRRIEAIDGGWHLLNHAKYREMASREESKAANAARQRRFKEKQRRNNAKVTDGNDKVTLPLHIADADTEYDRQEGVTRVDSPERALTLTDIERLETNGLKRVEANKLRRKLNTP